MQPDKVPALAALPRPASLVEQVVAALRAEVAAGRFARTARLPAEQALSTTLGVSRTVLREALAQLKADGVLVSRKGSGVYVSATPAGNAFRLPAVGGEPERLREVFELRYYAETGAAELAAARRGPADLRRLQAALRAMRARGAAAADAAFHRAIAVATQNPHFVALVDLLSGQLHQVIAASWENAARVAGGPRDAIREHAALYRAIRSGDPAAAREAAAAHLTGAARRWGLALGGAPARPRRGSGR
ncbi:MAG: FadR family transcriptional regulator [Deltaproteobacteria bacterium]|nr:FadR family transcriptional regulator [Deltaproteobacteria bacterium]